MLYINLRFIFYHSHLRWVKWKMLSQKLWKWIPKAAGFKSPSASGPGAAPHRSSSPHTTNPLPAAPKPRFSSPKPTNRGRQRSRCRGPKENSAWGNQLSHLKRQDSAIILHLFYFLQRLYEKQMFQEGSWTRWRLLHGEKCLRQCSSPKVNKLHHKILDNITLPSIPGFCILQVLLTHRRQSQLIQGRKMNKTTNKQNTFPIGGPQNTFLIPAPKNIQWQIVQTGKQASLCAPSSHTHTHARSFCRSRFTYNLCTQRLLFESDV